MIFTEKWANDGPVVIYHYRPYEMSIDSAVYSGRKSDSSV